MKPPREFWIEELPTSYRLISEPLLYLDKYAKIFKVHEVAIIDWEKVWEKYDESKTKNSGVDERTKRNFFERLVECALKGEL